MTTALVPRVLVVVCDSWGVGDAPDAATYGDEGSDTLANTAEVVGGIHAPNLEARCLRGAGLGPRTGDGALGGEGHDDGSLGDDGDPS